ncbi:hypothetical protein L3K78_14920, partial [Oscillospiraceae bacterium SCCA1]|nr:hypothetical protein [Oscillospiraceae bacterium SCCA1]
MHSGMTIFSRCYRFQKHPVIKRLCLADLLLLRAGFTIRGCFFSAYGPFICYNHTVLPCGAGKAGPAAFPQITAFPGEIL